MNRLTYDVIITLKSRKLLSRSLRDLTAQKFYKGLVRGLVYTSDLTGETKSMVFFRPSNYFMELFHHRVRHTDVAEFDFNLLEFYSAAGEISHPLTKAMWEWDWDWEENGHRHCANCGNTPDNCECAEFEDLVEGHA